MLLSCSAEGSGLSLKKKKKRIQGLEPVCFTIPTSFTGHLTWNSYLISTLSMGRTAAWNVNFKHWETAILVTCVIAWHTCRKSRHSEFKAKAGRLGSTHRCTSYVALEEQRWSSRAWHVSHTRTGFGEAGRGNSLSEQALQKISPQFLQWCCERTEEQ